MATQPEPAAEQITAPVSPATEGDDFATQAASVFGFSGDEDFFGEGGNGATPEPGPASAGAERGEGGGDDQDTVTPPSEPQPQTTLQPASTTPAQPASTPGQQTEQSAAPSDAEARLRIASMEAELARLRAAQVKPQTPAEGGTPPAEEQGKGDEVPAYNLQLPSNILEAVDSDDPQQRGAALNAIVNGVLATAHRIFNQQYAAREERLMAKLEAREASRSAESEAATAAASMKEQYFTAFPTHKSPLLEPIIATINAQMATEMPGAAWNEDWMNALGARVNKHLEELGVRPETPAAPAATTPTPKPAAFMPSGPRSTSTPGSEPTFAEEVETVFGFHSDS